jgi:CrcB protein
MQAIVVALAGALGTLLRYAAGLAAARLSELPAGTLFVNVVGSFALGFVAEALAGVEVFGCDARLVLGTGLLGGFTTYSSFNLETLKLAQEGQPLLAGAYVAATLLGCLAAGAAGLALAGAR